MSAADRVPLDDDYALRIGRAVFIFARLEWQVVWCGERMQTGFISLCRRSTAGRIADSFSEVVATNAPGDEEAFAAGAAQFRELVKVRNDLVHAKPCTAPDGAQRLSRSGIWQPEQIDDAADRFAECDSELNQLYYKWWPTHGTE